MGEGLWLCVRSPLMFYRASFWLMCIDNTVYRSLTNLLSWSYTAIDVIVSGMILRHHYHLQEFTINALHLFLSESWSQNPKFFMLSAFPPTMAIIVRNPSIVKSSDFTTRFELHSLFGSYFSMSTLRIGRSFILYQAPSASPDAHGGRVCAWVFTDTIICAVVSRPLRNHP